MVIIENERQLAFPKSAYSYFIFTAPVHDTIFRKEVS